MNEKFSIKKELLIRTNLRNNNHNDSAKDRAAEPSVRLKQIRIRLKERDFRLAPRRLAILKILAGSIGFTSVDKFFEQVKGDFPTTSRGKVDHIVNILK